MSVTSSSRTEALWGRGKSPLKFHWEWKEGVFVEEPSRGERFDWRLG